MSCTSQYMYFNPLINKIIRHPSIKLDLKEM